MYGNRATEYQKREALRNLRDQGVVKVEIAFSGGNDEGGAESVRAYDAAGNEVNLPNSDAHEGSEWDANTKTWKSTGWTVYEGYDREARKSITRPATPEEIAAARTRVILEEPIYDRYGSFAGEFYVDGTLTWDVLAGTNKMKGQEELRHWEEFEV